MEQTEPPAGRVRWLVLLSSGVAVSFGCLFYAFSVLLTQEAAGAAFSATVLSAGYGGSVLVSGGLAYWIGRRLDRTGVKAVFVTGGLLGTAGMLAFAAAREPWQVVAASWLLVGPAGGMTFYEPAFAAVDQWFDAAQRTRSLAVLTLVGGLAGPIFLPLTGALVGALGWRAGSAILAGCLALTTAASAVGLPSLRPDSSPERPGPARLRHLLADRRFVLFTAAIVTTFGCLQALFFHRIAAFEQAGFTVGAVTAWAALSGLLGFPGRYAGPYLARRTGGVPLQAAALAGLAATVAVLGLHPEGWGMPVHFVTFGLLFGIMLPLRAVVMSGWYSGPGYATIMGLQWSLTAIAGAAGPALVGVARDALGGYAAPMVVVAGVLVLAAAFTVAAGRRGTR
jgi:predicted MFS family arabinose efflux permease